MNSGIKNLIPNSQRTESELKEMTRKGGINSGIARRARRDFLKLLDVALENELLDTGMTGSEILVTQLFVNAMNGDTQAIKTILDRKYGKPKQQIDNISSDGSMSPQVTPPSKPTTCDIKTAMDSLEHLKELNNQ